MIDDLLARILVIGSPPEVALHVSEPEQGLRPNVFEPRHAGKRHLERDYDLTLDLFCTPTLGLGNEFDEWRYRIRICLNVELCVGNETREDQREHGEDHRARRV